MGVHATTREISGTGLLACHAQLAHMETESTVQLALSGHSAMLLEYPLAPAANSVILMLHLQQHVLQVLHLTPVCVPAMLAFMEMD